MRVLQGFKTFQVSWFRIPTAILLKMLATLLLSPLNDAV